MHGKGEYFGTNAGVSLAYCQGGRKMVVFVVLMDPTGLVKEDDHQYNMVVINKP